MTVLLHQVRSWSSGLIMDLTLGQECIQHGNRVTYNYAYRAIEVILLEANGGKDNRLSLS